MHKHPYDAKMARNRSALGSVLAPGASKRDILACHTETTTVVGSSYIWQKQTYGRLPAANLVNPVRRHQPEGAGPMLAQRANIGPALDQQIPPLGKTQAYPHDQTGSFKLT